MSDLLLGTPAVLSGLTSAPVTPGYWRAVGGRLLRDPVTLVVSLLLVLIVLMAIFAPLVATQDPYAGSVLRRLKPIGTPGHSWQLTAQGKSPAAHKGLAFVAKVMAATAVRAVEDPALIERAKADLAQRTRATPYVSPLPDGVEPPIAAMSMSAS